MNFRRDVEKSLLSLSKSQKAKVDELIKEREIQFLAQIPLSSYILDYRFRGVDLSPEKLREGMQYISTMAADSLNVPRPTTMDLKDFLEKSGIHHDDAWIGDVKPGDYWAFFKESPLGYLGKIFSQLPGSTADLERHFSGAQFVAEGRERLTPTNLFQEAYIRENRRALKALRQGSC